MRYRSPARYVAPVALVVAAVVVVIVVKGASDKDDGSAPASETPVTTVKRNAASRFYTVRSGDILSRVAERTGVSVSRILELNPKLDPNALRPGQRLRLTP